jgi:hypothetical protein
MDLVDGRLARVDHRGRRIMNLGPRLTFWRATTDNDRAGWGPSRYAVQWLKMGMHRLQHRVDEVRWEKVDRGAARVSVRSRIAPPVLGFGIEAEYVYHVGADGSLRVEVRGRPKATLPTVLPRVGLQLHLDGALERVERLGLGPHESYPDSRMSARMGRWARRLPELETPYVFPQENGNRSEVRWVTTTDASGAGLMARGMPRLCFSAHRNTPEEYEEARHTVDLVPRGEIVLILDYRQNGLGSASCGPGVLPQYVLTPQDFEFAVDLLPVGPEGRPPGAAV